MAGPAILPGIGSLVGTYDAFLIDQWGVLHRGRPAAAAPVAALARLREAGKRVAILTNSGRRAADNVRRLVELGFPSSLFDAVMSSGELAWRRIHARAIPWLRTVGNRCLFFSRDDPAYLDGLGLEPVDDVEAADFVLAVGVEPARRSFADYERVLRRAWERRLRLICANTDLKTPDGEHLLYGCGALAACYADWGGDVTYFGKPYPDVFRGALDALGGGAGMRVLVIGDSLLHDIAGARNAGLDSALILDGVHAADVAEAPVSGGDSVRALCGRHGVEPDFALPSFRW